ncbi:MAG: hypothetical protein RLZZ582_1 [Verrucomicrobiota bacterium]
MPATIDSSEAKREIFCRTDRVPWAPVQGTSVSGEWVFVPIRSYDHLGNIPQTDLVGWA